jgi:hypothetical protein
MEATGSGKPEIKIKICNAYEDTFTRQNQSFSARAREAP